MTTINYNDNEHPFTHLVNQYVFVLGKFFWRGKLCAVIGTHLILDECDQLFWADADSVRSEGSDKPIHCGDGVVIHADWIECAMPASNTKWFDEWRRAKGQRQTA